MPNLTMSQFLKEYPAEIRRLLEMFQKADVDHVADRAAEILEGNRFLAGPQVLEGLDEDVGAVFQGTAPERFESASEPHSADENITRRNCGPVRVHALTAQPQSLTPRCRRG